MEPLTQVLIVLACCVVLVTSVRRLGWPAQQAYLLVGVLAGPHALGVLLDTATTRLLAELGVAFLLFTLGLEFSFPRMVAMRREVFGLGSLQLLVSGAAFAVLARPFGVSWPTAAVVGGAIAMSSTAILLQQLSERAELNRTHGRLAFAMLLFQDLAFVPLLALASALGGNQPVALAGLGAVVSGSFAILGVLALGRWLLRPLFQLIATSRLRELFTLTVLLVVLAAAWTCQKAGLSLELGAFLAGILLAETEYRHQVESVILPFRDILLGLFFISIGMLLDARLLGHTLPLVLAILAGVLLLKTLLTAIAARLFGTPAFKALRTGILMAVGGEFGVALCSVLLRGGQLPDAPGQALLLALVLSMIASPLIVGSNRRLARLVLREHGPPQSAIEREAAAARAIIERTHVLLCGYGRVGQSVARVLENQGFEYVALDLDPARIRAARQAGDPVLYGDCTDEEMLARVGLGQTSVVVITFADPAIALSILRSVRRLRPQVPVLVRTADEAGLRVLEAAGATGVVPETVEASLMLVAQLLMLLQLPVGRVLRVIDQARRSRYAVFRSRLEESVDFFGGGEPGQLGLRSVVLPPAAWAVGQSLESVRRRGAAVTFTGVRRHGILGREPEPGTVLREGDIVVMYGAPEELEHAEALLLAG